MIATVLRSGGIYRAEHVRTLRAACRQWAPGEPFGCLTDTPIPGILCHKLQHDWPIWWSKIELFRPGVFTPGTRVLYLDLDTVVLGPLFDLLARPEPFLALADFYRRPPLTRTRGLGSGVLQWTADDWSELYRAFAAAPEEHMRTCGYGGDQWYLELRGMRDQVTFWEDVCPGAIVSYKVHCEDGRVPAGARVVCFHGRPKPWQVPSLEGTSCRT